MTVDELFGFIEDGFDQNAVQVRVSYDSVLGYPVEAWIDYRLNTIYEEHGFAITNFSAN